MKCSVALLECMADEKRMKLQDYRHFGDISFKLSSLHIAARKIVIIKSPDRMSLTRYEMNLAED
jgi:hypothetical protein